MLCIRIIFLALLGYYVRGAVVQNYDANWSFMKRFYDVMQKRCLRNANETQFEEVLGAVSRLENCLMDLILYDRDASVDEMKKYFVNELPRSVECTKRFVDTLEPCLDTKESYLKELLLESYQNVARFIGEHLHILKYTENPYEAPMIVCEFRFDGQYETHPRRACFVKSKIFGDNSTLDVATKEEFCHDLKDIIDCYDKLYTETCYMTPDWVLFKIGSMREGFTPCLDVVPVGTTENSEEAT